jgi:hypothetical protein
MNILDKLIWINNMCTKNGSLGDAMSANAALALVTPADKRIDDFVTKSFIGERPFRSPAHASDPSVDLTHSFSRDHCLSLAWYSLWSGKTWPLLSISRYANKNRLKIGKEGTYSQHGVTPNVMWAFNAVCEQYETEGELPWYYIIWPSWVIALIQLLSARTVLVGYRLNLCAEMALFARITGKWNWIWQKVADKCVERQPENLYYQFIQNRRNASEIQKDLEVLMETFTMDHEWCWCWMTIDENGKLKACGQDLLLLEKLLRYKQRRRK